MDRGPPASCSRPTSADTRSTSRAPTATSAKSIRGPTGRSSLNHDIAARLNDLAPTPIHRWATAIAGVGSFFDLFDIFLAGVLGTVLSERFGLGPRVLPLV